mmetsp:Transcript_95210/g.306795  ORF Transcript_95210/g.306795 Transcript_95210/m.306795 type:complete len:775 (-) Transcript_95210:50-2374(-)
MPPEVGVELRQDERLRGLLVQSSAIQETEVLLGLKSAFGQQPHAALVEQITADSYDEVKRLLDEGGADLMQRDPHGNLPAHHCRSISVYRLLAVMEPKAMQVRNKQGQTPLECLWDRAASIQLLQEFWCGGPAPVGGEDHAPVGPEAGQLLRLDEHGVSLCMRAEGKARDWLLEQLGPWDDFSKYFKMLESLPDGLNKISPEGHWREVLAFHLFGEVDVWKDGKLSAQCQVRLEEFGVCLKLLCQRVLKRTPEPEARHALDALEILLEATRGPAKLLDAREPYRKELNLEMLNLATQCEAIHEILYAMMSGQAATWLKGFVDEKAWEKLDPFGLVKPDPIQQRRQRQKLRMDFELAAGGRHLAAPAWVRADMEFDFAQVLRDLRHVGGAALEQCLGQETCGDADVIYRMLEGAHGFGPDSFPSDLASFCEPSVAFWYALWLRGLCQGRHDLVIKGLQHALGVLDFKPLQAKHPWDKEANFFPAMEAMGLEELCAKVLEEMRDIYGEIRETLVPEGGGDPDSEALARHLMASAPGFVVCMNSATLIFEDADGLSEAFNVLKASFGGILQVWNAFHKKAPVADDGRRLKVWVPVKTDRYGPLLAEVTLMLADDYWENCWHRLPLAYFCGGLDRHTTPTRPSTDALEKYTKVKFQLNPALIPESKSKHIASDVDEETQRKMRELQERKAREEERLRQEEIKRKREELERKLKEASADFDPDQCEVRETPSGGTMIIRPPVEVLPKTKRCEALQMKKLEQFNKKKAEKEAAKQEEASG